LAESSISGECLATDFTVFPLGSNILLTSANVGIREVSSWFLVEEISAQLAIPSSRVVHTTLAHSSTDPTGLLVNRLVKVADNRVLVAVAPFACVSRLSDGWLPRKIIVEVHALLAVVSLSVVCAVALAVDHVRDVLLSFRR